MFEPTEPMIRRERAEMTQVCVTKARFLRRTLGVRAAAGYLRNRGFRLATSLFILTGSRREYNSPSHGGY